MSTSTKIIAIIGPNADKCTPEMYAFGVLLGKKLVDEGYTIVNGGRFGMMEAVFKGAHQSANYVFGKTVGILPGVEKTAANSYCDIIIPSGMGIARNALVVNSGDAVVAVAGGAGTLSELAMAWQLGKKVIAYTGFLGWAKALAGTSIDGKKRSEILKAQSIPDILKQLKEE